MFRIVEPFNPVVHPGQGRETGSNPLVEPEGCYLLDLGVTDQIFFRVPRGDARRVGARRGPGGGPEGSNRVALDLGPSSRRCLMYSAPVPTRSHCSSVPVRLEVQISQLFMNSRCHRERPSAGPRHHASIAQPMIRSPQRGHRHFFVMASPYDVVELGTAPLVAVSPSVQPPVLENVVKRVEVVRRVRGHCRSRDLRPLNGGRPRAAVGDQRAVEIRRLSECY